MRSPVLSLGQNWKSPPARPRLSPVTCHSAVRLSCMLQRIYKGSAAPSAVPLHSAKRIYRLCSACNKIRSRCRAYSRAAEQIYRLCRARSRDLALCRAQTPSRHSLDDSAVTGDTQIYFLEATRPPAPVAWTPVISLIPTCHCHGRAHRCVYALQLIGFGFGFGDTVYTRAATNCIQ